MNKGLQQFTSDALRTEPTAEDYTKAIERIKANPDMIRLLHVGMGLMTEVGEFMDMLKKHIFYGKPLDTVNLREELGDVTWYERIGVDALHDSYEGILTRNVEKLKARFPNKFTEENATVRDLDTERKILEG